MTHKSFLFSLLFLNFWDITYLFSSPLTSDLHLDVKHELSSQWNQTKFKQPLGFQSIFKNLDPRLWPLLPESYEWRTSKDNTQVLLYKHEWSNNHTFDFVTYATDELEQFDFLSRWDDITHHSFAYSHHNSKLTGGENTARKYFPVDEFKYKGLTYVRGHCIDYLDTYGLCELSVITSKTVIHSIPTLDPRNYIPEPCKPHQCSAWGTLIRKQLVGKIRSNSDCYAQYMYYPNKPNKTDNADPTAIPEGIYFLDIPKTKPDSLQSYHVDWSQDLTSSKNWQKRLKALKSPRNFYPTPVINGFEDKKLIPVLVSAQLKTSQPWEYYHKLLKSADYEIDNISGKITLILYLFDIDEEEIKIKSWIKRLISHINILHERNIRDVLKENQDIKEILRIVKRLPNFDNEKVIQDYLKQVIAQDSDISKITSKLADINLSDHNTLTPIKEIDIDEHKSPGEGVAQAIKILKKHGRVRLINLTTLRANRLAEQINSQFKLSERKKFNIEYIDKKSPQTKGNRTAFTTIGIEPRRIDFDQIELEKSDKQKTENKQTFKTVAQSIKKKKAVSTLLDASQIQCLERIRSNGEICQYYTCPTVGDGNCFFHAVFTESNNRENVNHEASEIRKEVSRHVNEDNNIHELKPLVHEYFFGLILDDKNHSEVPQNIKDFIKEKNEYTDMLNKMKKFGLETDGIELPETKFSDDNLRDLIKPNHVKDYIGKFRYVGEYDTYIPFRPEAFCLVDLISQLKKKSVNIFTFDSDSKRLRFMKTSGIENSEQAINILHTGSHFLRIISSDNLNNARDINQAEQIYKNFLQNL